MAIVNCCISISTEAWGVMVSDLKMSKKLSHDDPMVLLRELKTIAPDIWGGDRRCSVLPQKLGGFEKPEYVEYLQNAVRELNEYRSMLNAEFISEVEYEIRKADVLECLISGGLSYGI